MEEQQVGQIKVVKLEDNPDGSANLEIETDREATRFLVEQGLIALLEKCIDRENKEYALSPELQSRQLADEIDEGLDALEEKRT
jgi:phosphosulfolactate synthase (CoM biosynthesis protein A)